MAEPFAFNPIDPEVRRDPYALYERGRREHPVFVHAGLPIPLVSIFGYADVQGDAARRRRVLERLHARA